MKYMFIFIFNKQTLLALLTICVLLSRRILSNTCPLKTEVCYCSPGAEMWYLRQLRDVTRRKIANSKEDKFLLTLQN